MKKIIMIMILLYGVVCLGASAEPTIEPTPGLIEPEIGAAAAILVERDSGTAIYEKNIHDRREPASLTKIMTCMLALERGNLSDILTVSRTAVEGLDPEGSTVYLTEGEQMSLEDLLYCMMVASANESCNVVGEYISGSIEEFVSLMNERASELGMTGTQFTNTHGLPDTGHYTTAYDMYLLAQQAVNTPGFMEICNTGSIAVAATNKSEDRPLRTTNYLINVDTQSKYFYKYAKGVKTGHTDAAGRCLVSCAEKDGLVYISVVMGAQVDRAEDGSSIIRSFTETKELFEWGFNNFMRKTIINANSPMTEIPVSLGLDKDAVTLVSDKSVEVLIPKIWEVSDFERILDIPEREGVTAPVAKGAEMGTATFMREGKEYGKVKLLTSYAVERSETEHIKETMTGIMSEPWVWYSIGGVAALVVIYVVYVLAVNTRRQRSRTRGSYRGKRRRRR